MTSIDTISWVLALPALIPFATFLLETGLGLASDRAHLPSSETDVRTTILMPAHNEAGGIGHGITELRSAMPPSAKLLVVADNCTDDTAAIARAAGAEVIERQHETERGKGHALAFGCDHLRSDPPECVLVLDADCRMDRESIARLASEARRLQAPVQADNRIWPNLLASPKVQISNFAFLVKNSVRQRGLTRIGGPALLTGTGMAFPWTLFATAPLASGDIVEDLALGIALTRAGHTPRYLGAASVWSDAAIEADTLTQRTRWEHGFLATARAHGLPLLLEGIGKGRPSLCWLGLNLLVPPLALLFVLGTAGLLAQLALCLLGSTPMPAILLGAEMAACGLLIVAAWFRFGRQTLAARTLLQVPLYILWKIPLYLKLFRGRETRWVRTRRPDEKA